MKITKYKIILLVTLIFSLISALFLLPDGLSVFAEEEPDEPGESETPAVALVDGTEYSSLEQALLDWTDGGTLTLLANVSAERRIDVSGEKTLDLNGYTLQGMGSGRTLQVEGTLVLKDGSALKSGKISGGGVRVNGTLKMESGNITENSAEDGGGVSVAETGSFYMSGGAVTGNIAYGNGGGVYVGGTLQLSGAAVITGNTNESGEDNNIYLPIGKTIDISSFTGEAGVSSLSLAPIALGEEGGKWKADNLIYTINYTDGVYSLALSPLATVVAQYKGEEIYPTTDLQSLKKDFTITASNANGVNYAGQYEILLDGTLTVGGSDITLTVTGEGGETAQTVVPVSVSAPRLTGVTALYDGEGKTVYFDTALTSLQSALTVTGAYSDGYSRVIYPTADETSAAAQEEYIVDYYMLSGDLSEHEGGTAEIAVTVGLFSQTVSVSVSKYVIDVSQIEIVPLTVMQQSGAWAIDPRDFVLFVPDGIEVIAMLDGQLLQANTLSAGVYTVEISFRVIDTDNYEEIEGSMQVTLTVNYASISGGADEAEYTVQTEGGIPLNWDMTITEISSSVKLEGDMEIKQAVTITLREDGYIVTETDKSVTVRLLLAESLRGKDFVLYRVLSDGSTVEVAAQTDGDYVIFETAHLSGIEYVLAVNSGYGIYLALTIVFGIVCLAGAGLLIWYFKVRRNMSIK